MTETATWVEQALDRYERPLTLYAEQLLRDVERARDVVQDTFLRLCRQQRSEVDGHLREWLFRVCRNRAFDVMRKDKRMESSSELMVANERLTMPSPSDVAEGREGLANVLDAVGTLPPQQREVLQLKFQQGMTYREIAGITELSVSNVGFLVHSAMKTLRSLLGAESAGAASPRGGVA